MVLRRPPLSPGARVLLGLAGVLAVMAAAPWPRIQLVLHVVTVLVLAPDPRNYLASGLLAAASGWALEGSLKLYPRLGGTPWAALTLCLAATFLAEHWPPENQGRWWLRCLGLTLTLALLTTLMVRLAAGAWPALDAWAWPLGMLPLWAWLGWRLQPGRG